MIHPTILGCVHRNMDLAARALKVVDMDGSGSLDFQELVTFLAVYRHAEGFTKDEVMPSAVVSERG